MTTRTACSIKQQKQRRNQEKPSKKSFKPSERGKQAKYYNAWLNRQNMSDTEQAYAGPAVPVQVITAARNLKSQPFIPGNDPIAKGKA